jgi:bifunctional DNA-binding transcriptional regulator/antitoxin component of YhaV-PrlF toxin-antitoxin module
MMDESGKVTLPKPFLQAHDIDLCTRLRKVLIYKDKVLCYLDELPGDSFITHQGNIPIDDVGAVTLPMEYLKEVGVAPNQSVWIVGEESDLVITKDLYGFGSCERESVIIDGDGKQEVPTAFLGRLEISGSEEVHATLMTGERGSTIWIKASFLR